MLLDLGAFSSSAQNSVNPPDCFYHVCMYQIRTEYCVSYKGREEQKKLLLVTPKVSWGDSDKKTRCLSAAHRP